MIKTGSRKRASSGRDRRPRNSEPREDDGPDEAAALIAETAADLTRLARRHKLEMLAFLLAMVQMEAEERVRLRSKRNLS